MTHKVHPKIFRIKGTDCWDSRGFYEENFALYLEEDFKIRKLLKEKVGKFGVGRVVIERSPGKINVIIFTARPGLIIGRGGEGVEKLKKELVGEILKGKPTSVKAKVSKSDLKIEIRAIKNPWAHAALIAQLMASQIEKRTAYRRVLKGALGKIMSQRGVKGARVEVSGRLNGVEIARREWLQDGLLPRQTLRADIDYVQHNAFCSYGVIGIKVWIYKGEFEQKQKIEN